MSERLPAVAFKADEDTLRILALLEQHEERRRSDVIRRALRFHAEHLGLIKPKAKRSAPANTKPKRTATNARARHGA